MPRPNVRHSRRETSILLVAFSIILFASEWSTAAFAQAYSLTGQTYTAQRKPRVAVMEFEDTNSSATSARYGPSVSAMLVTFLKTKSQFVVVERQNINLVLDEWKNNQTGLTNLVLDETQSEILEKLDVILMGNVTLLPDGIEVDAKLLSRVDGRIIAAAERSGPTPCLRQVVDRVGVAIEKAFLTPYYGNLKISLTTPENTRLHLTPVLANGALDEEKPPIELGFTIHPGAEQDQVRQWVTYPTTYTIKNVLGGWYTLRLERPGYQGRGINNALLEARTSNGETYVYNLLEKRTIHHREMTEPWRPGLAEWKKYMVHVAPLQTREIDATARFLFLRKKSGEFRLTVLDETAQPVSGTQVSLVSRDLELNPKSPDQVDSLEAEKEHGTPAVSETQTSAAHTNSLHDERRYGAEIASGTQANPPYPSQACPQLPNQLCPQPQNRMCSQPSARTCPQPPTRPRKSSPATPRIPKQDEGCQFLVDQDVPSIDHGRRLVRANGTFDIDTFEGGMLAFENYSGATIPEGTYEAFIWAPYYKPRSVMIHVDDGTEPQNVSIRLARMEQELLLRGKSENMIAFSGIDMGYDRKIPLDVETGEELVRLPVDRYRVDTDIIGFRSWLQELDLLPPHDTPPSLEDLLPPDAAAKLAREEGPEPIELRIKNRVWVAGRFEDFRRHPGVFYDRKTSELLDVILGDPTTFDWDFRIGDQESDDLLELEERLQDVDLLILNEDDMSFIRVLPDLQTIVRRFVDSGRALMAFVTWDGDFSSVVGAPLTVKRRTTPSSKLKLNPGELNDFETKFKVNLGATRALPKPRHRRQALSDWRILSYTKKGKRPRVIERGSLEEGGYVMVWFESSRLKTEPGDFTSRGIPGTLGKLAGLLSGKKPKEVRLDNEAPPEEVGQQVAATKRARKRLERELWVSLKALATARDANQSILMAKSMLKSHALKWAEYLMYREFDAEGEDVSKARQRLAGDGAR